MTAYDPVEYLRLTCQTDAQFYVCAKDSTTKTFLGCCTTDPCAKDECPDENLRPSMFDPDMWGDIPAQACMADNAAWWTCSFGMTFIGCCEDNPCQADPGPACPKVRPARISENRTAARIFLEGPAVIASDTATTLLPTATSTPSDAAGAGTDGQDGGNNTVLAAAVGATSGALALIVIAGAIFWYLRRKRRANAANAAAQIPAWQSPGAPGAAAVVTGAATTDDPNSPYPHNANLLPLNSPMHSPSSPLVQQEKTSAAYASGVSELDSQVYASSTPNSPQPPPMGLGVGMGYNPAKGYSTSPGQSPYATPYGSQANSPAPYQTEFAHNRVSSVSGYGQSYNLPASPSPNQQQTFPASASTNPYASPPPVYAVEMDSTPAPPRPQNDEQR